MRPDRPRAPESKARPAGTGYIAEDLPLARLIVAMVASGEAKSRTEAARKVAHMARGASPEAIVDRLVRLCRRLPVIPARPAAESRTPSSAMSTRTGHPDPAPDARIAAMQHQIALLQDAQAAMAERIAENELMVAECIEQGAALRRENARLKAALATYTKAAQRRLARLGAPRSDPPRRRSVN
jgi:hypothetical protein